LHLGKKLCPFIVIESDEGRPRIIQAVAVRVSEQSPKRSSFAVSISPDHDKSGFGKAFALEPSLAAPRAITSECLFGNNALKPMLGTGFKENGTLTNELFAKLNAAVLIPSN
jgi:hypothetical protein